MASSLPSRSTPRRSLNREAPLQPGAPCSPPPMKLPPFFEEDRLAVDAALERLLPAQTAPPSSVHTAMHYSVFAGGKRIRPILCLETARIFTSDVTPALHPACALESIHRPKTAALIRASIPAGALCAGAGPEDVARLRRFGETIGWAFQVTDDILDVEESSAALGKTAGKDMAQQKATYPSVFGLERSHEIAKDLATKAIAELIPYAERASRLREIAEFLVLRRA